MTMNEFHFFFFEIILTKKLKHNPMLLRKFLDTLNFEIMLIEFESKQANDLRYIIIIYNVFKRIKGRWM